MSLPHYIVVVSCRRALPQERPKPDVEDIKFVINYDYPNSSEDYVHRIGRTGRSSQTGTAYTFFTPGNIKQAKDLIEVLQEAKQVVNPKLLQLAESARGYSKGRFRGGRSNDYGSRFGGSRFGDRSGGRGGSRFDSSSRGFGNRDGGVKGFGNTSRGGSSMGGASGRGGYSNGSAMNGGSYSSGQSNGYGSTAPASYGQPAAYSSTSWTPAAK